MPCPPHTPLPFLSAISKRTSLTSSSWSSCVPTAQETTFIIDNTTYSTFAKKILIRYPLSARRYSRILGFIDERNRQNSPPLRSPYSRVTVPQTFELPEASSASYVAVVGALHMVGPQPRVPRGWVAGVDDSDATHQNLIEPSCESWNCAGKERDAWAGRGTKEYWGRREKGEGALHVFPSKSRPQFLPCATAF